MATSHTTERVAPARDGLDPGRWRRNARAVVLGYVLAVVGVAIAWVAMLVLGDMAGRRALGLAALGVGGALVVTGGNAIERLVTLDSSSWGVSVNRHRELIGREYSDVGSMTSLGMAVLVGLPVMLIGGALVR